jgi:hypothetical protein
MQRSKSLRLAASAASALLLASCSASWRGEGLPAALAVDQPSICEDVLDPPRLPPKPGRDDDAIAALVENRGTAKVAIETIVAGRSCIRDQRQLYAGKGGD